MQIIISRVFGILDKTRLLFQNYFVQYFGKFGF